MGNWQVATQTDESGRARIAGAGALVKDVGLPAGLIFSLILLM